MANSEAGAAAADWKLVYIAEAHAMDEWPVLSGRFNLGRGPVCVEKQPVTLFDRCQLARSFVWDFDIVESASLELLVDDPEQGDPFEKEYAPWPVRIYLIRDGKMEWIPVPKDCSYDGAVMELMGLLGLA